MWWWVLDSPCPGIWSSKMELGCAISDHFGISYFGLSQFLRWRVSSLDSSNSWYLKLQNGVRSTVHTLDDSMVHISSWFHTLQFQHSWRESSEQLHLRVCETPNGVSSTFLFFALRNFWIPTIRVLDISNSHYPNLRYGVFDISWLRVLWLWDSYSKSSWHPQLSVSKIVLLLGFRRFTFHDSETYNDEESWLFQLPVSETMKWSYFSVCETSGGNQAPRNPKLGLLFQICLANKVL